MPLHRLIALAGLLSVMQTALAAVPAADDMLSDNPRSATVQRTDRKLGTLGRKTYFKDVLKRAAAGEAVQQSLYGLVAYEIKNFSEAEYWLTKSADQDNTQAQTMLALLYSRKDTNRALAFARKAGDKGDVRAQRIAGDIYAGRKELKSAIVWYRRAAHQGDGKSTASLGLAYARLGDWANADPWLQMAPRKGYANALTTAGSIAKAQGDKTRAHSLWKKACSHGEEPACAKIKTLSE